MEEFLAQIFGDDLTPERRIAVFTKPSGQTRFFSDYGQLEQYARGQAAEQDVYFGLGLIAGTPRGRGKREDVAGIGALWCDIDVHGPAHQRANLPGSIAEAELLLAEMPLTPSMVVHSGHGLHAYWLLKEPWIFTDDRDQAASLTRRWHALVCDRAARHGWALENLGDLTRVLRLPGTLNHNGDGEPRPVELAHCEPTRRYDADDFEPHLPAPHQEGDAHTGHTGHTGLSDAPLVLRADAEPPADRLVALTEGSPAFRATWNRRRDDLGDNSQSGYDLSLATIAALSDWTDQQIANLLIAHRRHGGSNPEKALRESYVRQTLARARRASMDGDSVDISALVPSDDSGGKRKRKFHLELLGHVEIKPPEWLLHGVLERDTLAMVFGEPGAGKSFLAIDWAARIATGTPWRENRVRQAPVVYIAGEGRQGLSRRYAAWQEYHGIAGRDAPLHIGPAGALTNFEFLNDVIEETTEEAGRPAMIVLDTLARNFGGSDENNTKDMNEFVRACDVLREQYRCTVLIVHHVGHGDKNRARGAIAMKGALDAEYRFAETPTGLVLTSTKMKEAEPPPPLALQLEKVALPGLFDEFGNPVTSAAIEWLDADTSSIESKAMAAVPVRRNRSQCIALAILQEQLERNREGAATPATEWRVACREAGVPRSTLSRAERALIEQGAIKVRDDWVMLGEFH